MAGILRIVEKSKELGTDKGFAVSMKTIFLEMIKLVGKAEGEISDQYFILSLAVDEDIVGMDVAKVMLLSIRIHLACCSSHHQQKVPEFFLCEESLVCLPGRDLFLEIGHVFVFKPGDKGTAVTACP